MKIDLLRIGTPIRVGTVYFFGDSKHDVLKHLALRGVLLYATEKLDLSLKRPIGTFFY